jgi:hypothetical protein
MNVFLGKSFKGIPTGELTKKSIGSFKQFCESYLKTCLQGEKNEYYITIGSEYSKTQADPTASPLSYKAQDHYHRNDKSQREAWLLPFDGDSSEQDKDSCIPPKDVHSILKSLNINHVVYTTHSHYKGLRNRWRLFVPCKLTSKREMQASVNMLFNQIKQHGGNGLKMSNESKTWSNPWFLPTRDDPDDGHFEYYDYHNGRDYIAVLPEDNESDTTRGSDSASEEESRTVSNMISIIQEGKPNTGLHRATRDLAYGFIRDGMSPGTVKAIMHALTKDYDMCDPRQKENKLKIDKLVDSALGKVTVDSAVSSVEWGELLPSGQQRVFTDYPMQSGMMEEIITTCMEWMPYPNRQIATIAAHALISVLGGRVYTLPSGSGIVLTALVTGRSTIGKSFIKKFCIHVLNNFQLAGCASQFIGSHYYTSSKNLIEELKESGTLLSIRTESGQTDKSTAGDMSRVMMYELELATESGLHGYISSGGQNDKIPPLFSPSVTTIRESVAEIQNEADLINATTIAGAAGRRSHVLIDPIKVRATEPRKTTLPKDVKKLIQILYSFADMSERKNVTSYLEDKFWIKVEFDDNSYLESKAYEWLTLENEAAAEESHFKSTFYGRLGERLPSWAARLAICDNPKKPIITNRHIDIAERSLLAELDAMLKQRESGMLDTDIEKCITFILNLFKGDLTKNKTLRGHHKNNQRKILESGAIKFNIITNLVNKKGYYKQAAAKYPSLTTIIESNLRARGLIRLSPEVCKEKFSFGGVCYQRT